MQLGFEAEAAQTRRAEEAPTVVSMRQGIKPADRRKPDADETKNRRLRKVKASFSSPGYYVIDASGGPVEGPFETYSLAIANLKGRAGIQYFDQAPGSSLIQSFPPQLNQVNGSKNMSDWDDAFLFTASDDDSDADDKDDDKKGSKPPWVHDSDDDHDDDDDSDSDDDSDDDDDDEDDKDSSHDDKDSDTKGKSNPPFGKDSSLLPIQVREARLLKAIANARPREAQRLMAELEGIRLTESLRIQASMEWAPADEYVAAALTPAISYMHHTAGTDWISDAADSAEAPAEIDNHMMTEAALWWSRTSAAVKQDTEELFAQASGMGQRTASQFAGYTDAAYKAFMEHVAFLRRREAAGEEMGMEDIDPNSSTGADSWLVPPMTLPGHNMFGDNFNGEENAEGARTWMVPGLDNGGGGSAAQASIHTANQYIKKQGDEWVILQKGTGKVLSHHDSEEKANASFAAMEMNKHGSDNFSAPRQSYDEALAQMSEQGKASAMTPDEYPGSLGAASPSNAVQTAQAALRARYAAELHPEFAHGFFHGHGDGSVGAEYGSGTEGRFRTGHGWAGNGVDHNYVQGYGEGYGVGAGSGREASRKHADSGKDLGTNPMAQYSPDQAHAQSGEAQSSLPLAPTEHVDEHFDWLTDFPNTGPGLVDSNRAPVIQENKQAKPGAVASKNDGGWQTSVCPDCGKSIRETSGADRKYKLRYNLDATPHIHSEASVHQASDEDGGGFWDIPGPGMVPAQPSAVGGEYSNNAAADNQSEQSDENRDMSAHSVLRARAAKLAPYLPKYAAHVSDEAIEADIRARAAKGGLSEAVTEMYVEAAIVLQADVKPDGTPASSPWFQEERQDATGGFGPIPVEGYAETDHGQMWPWDVDLGGGVDVDPDFRPRGAADVAGTPAPGIGGGSGASVTSAFRARVQANLGR